MRGPTRRRLLQVGSAATVAALAGCLSIGDGPAAEAPNGDNATDCGAMYDSVLRVEDVETTVDDAYLPIEFEDLPSEEQSILATVVDASRYETCDTSEAFRRFVDRVSERTRRQPSDDARVYLERDGTFYRLYVEVADQVYAY